MASKTKLPPKIEGTVRVKYDGKIYYASKNKDERPVKVDFVFD